jgi:predicted ferric reductase
VASSRSAKSRSHRSSTQSYGLRPSLLLVLYLGLILAPLGLAYVQGIPSRRWADELSSGLALSAYAGLLIEFVLLGRFHLVSDAIGIDTTMRFHQLIARSLTVIILLHPFLYATPLMGHSLPSDTTERLTLGLTSLSMWTGLVAWLALMVMVLLAIFRDQWDVRYETWRLSHGIAAVILALFGAHHTIEAGRYSGDPTLATYWLVLLAVALFTLLWVYALKPALQLRNPYEVRSARQIALKTWELVVAPKQGEAIDFAPGQFVWLNVGRSPFSLRENPFSIASAPGEKKHLSFVIKEAGDFTRGIGRIAPSTIAHVDGPHGNLTIGNRAGAGIALIAGGVGIAPLLSILRELCRTKETRPIVLLYGNRLQEQIVYAEELAEMQGELDLRVEHVLGEPPASWQGRTGVIDAALIKEIFGNPAAATWLYLVCGPLPMIEGVEKALLSLGVPGRQIVSERFYYD